MSLPLPAQRAWDAGAAACEAGQLSEAPEHFLKAVQACDAQRSFAPNVAFVECLRATASGYEATEAPNHPGALSHVERALDIARSLVPTTGPPAVMQQAGCEAQISNLLSLQGHNTESLAAAERGLALLAIPGCMDVPLYCELAVFSSLGITAVGKLDEAMEALAHAQAQCKLQPQPLFDEELRLLVSAESNVSLHMGKLPQAVKLFRQTLAMAERLHGPDSNNVAGACINLGSAKMQSNDFHSALRHYDRAAAILTAGGLRQSTALTFGKLQSEKGVTFLSLGHFERALASYQDALEIFRGVLPPDHPLIGRALHGIAKALQY